MGPVPILEVMGPHRTSDTSGSTASANKEQALARGVSDVPLDDGEIVLNEADNYEDTAFCFSPRKRWMIISIIAIVQISMNFNASVIGNAVKPMSEHFDISERHARLAQCVFLVAYAFGSELWAPWSEEYGRWIVLQLSLFFVNVFQIPCALAPSMNWVIAGRVFGGLSSAGGSVTLGMVADMWQPESQQYAVAFVVLSSVLGSVVGPVFGGIIQQYLPWQWNFWVQLIFGVAVQALHFFCTPETRSTVMLDKLAKKRRKAGEDNIVGPTEAKGHGLTVKEVLNIWYRPFKMFATEPIVLFLSLLSGFSDALIFTFLDAFPPVFRQWGFGTIELGLAFIPIGIGYFLAWISYLVVIYYHSKNNRAHSPERRLWWLLWVAPLLPIGLAIFAGTSLGPSYNIPWAAAMIGPVLIGIANSSIYMGTIDYMVASYGVYAASATGGNALARDFLAGMAALYSTPMYQNLGGSQHRNLQYGTTLLTCLAVVVIVPIYIFYCKGPWFRERSKFAQDLAAEREKEQHRMADKRGEV